MLAYAYGVGIGPSAALRHGWVLIVRLWARFGGLPRFVRRVRAGFCAAARYSSAPWSIAGAVLVGETILMPTPEPGTAPGRGGSLRSMT